MEPTNNVGDTVEVFTKADQEKRGRWSYSKQVLTVDSSGRTITVPSRKGATKVVVLEDTRPACLKSYFAKLLAASIVKLDSSVEYHLEADEFKKPLSKSGGNIAATPVLFRVCRKS